MKIEKLSLENYFGLLKNLSSEVKLDLIEQLSSSLKEDIALGGKSKKRAFGLWQSDESADEIVQKLKDDRNFNRKIESF